VYPMHPRTKQRLQENYLYDKIMALNNVLVLPPLGYFDFLILMCKCEFIVTDSGGIQEEATAPSIRKPVLVVRLSTERQEAVEAGFAKVVGTKKADILQAMQEILSTPKDLPYTSPFGDGKAAERIVEIIKKDFA
jgi:UDP-N-acetylglucosamine 2-epimerase (non-hydrolysing)